MNHTRLAHFSDIHLPALPSNIGKLSVKQFLGYLSWQSKRRFRYSKDVLDIMAQDVQQQNVNHICISGDQTNLGTEHEYQHVTKWLSTLAPADKISVIPGNHDAYSRDHLQYMTRYWAPYMMDHFSHMVGTPYIRKASDDVMIIGVSSAVPTAWFMANGRLANDQENALRSLLKQANDSPDFKSSCKVMMIHHPPVPGLASWRRGLWGIKKLLEIAQSYDISLILHGHLHMDMYHDVALSKTINKKIPVLGVAAAGSTGQHGLASQYYLIDIEKKNDPSDPDWHISIKSRGYSHEKRCFQEVDLPA